MTSHRVLKCIDPIDIQQELVVDYESSITSFSDVCYVRFHGDPAYGTKQSSSWAKNSNHVCETNITSGSFNQACAI